MVLDVLEARFQLRPISLSAKDLGSEPQYPFLDCDTRVLLGRIMHVYDQLETSCSFLLVEPISVLVFLSVYTLSQASEGSLVGGAHKEDFLASFAPIIAEVISALA
jgi:hypothetical protein